MIALMVAATYPVSFVYTPLFIRLLIAILGLTQLTACSGERYTALMNAARNGDSDAVSRMLDLGANINEQTSKGKTALMLAAAGGFTDTVKQLAERGADVRLKDDYDTTALIAAATGGHTDTAVLLMEYGADPTFKDTSGGSALGNATFFGYTETVRTMLDHMSELPDEVGDELLMLAAGLGHQQIAEALLKKGVSPNARGIKQRTALMAAVAFEKTELVKLLLEHGADIKASDDDGVTAIAVAEDNGSQEILQLLQKYQHKNK